MTKRDVIAFLRALAIGTAVGGGPWMLLTVPFGMFGFADGQILGGLILMVFPLIIAGGIVLASMILVGLPVTAFLDAHDRECPRIYGLCGAVAGILVPFAVMAVFLGPPDFTAAGLYLLPLGGMCAGLATALSWGRHRKRLRNEACEAADPNPIHDLIH